MVVREQMYIRNLDLILTVIIRRNVTGSSKLFSSQSY